MAPNNNQTNTQQKNTLSNYVVGTAIVAAAAGMGVGTHSLITPDYSEISKHPQADATYTALKKTAEEIVQKNKTLDTLGAQILVLKKAFYGASNNYYVEQSPEIAEKSRAYNELEQRVVGDTYYLMRSVYMNPALSEKSAHEIGRMVLGDVTNGFLGFDFDKKWGQYHYMKPFMFFNSKVKFLDECRQQSVSPANTSPDDDYKAVTTCLAGKSGGDMGGLFLSFAVFALVAVAGLATNDMRKIKKQEKAAKAPAV